MDASVKQIEQEHVVVTQKSQVLKVPAQAVYLMTGYHPDVSFLDKAGVTYDPASLEPAISEATLQTNVTGLYLAGSIIAGRNANRIFIENSRDHGSLIVSDILQRDAVTQV